MSERIKIACAALSVLCTLGTVFSAWRSFRHARRARQIADDIEARALASSFLQRHAPRGDGQ